MISYEEALSTVLSHARPLPARRLKLENLLGSYLARPLVAGHDMPLFDNSAVDGFGVHLADAGLASKDIPARLSLSGVVQAGDQRNMSLQPGEAVKILTGAPVPAGAEAIVMREYCEERENDVFIQQKPRPEENIRKQGEEFRKGDTILPAGTLVTPPVIGLLAACGQTSFHAHQKPRVALISTGNELIKPGKPLAPGQIYESNSYTLAAALNQLGIHPYKIYHVKDESSATRRTLSNALRESDVVIPLGGVSVGDYDLVKETLAELGVQRIFWKIAIKPGKPIYFGKSGNGIGKREKLVFGLPGNPVSALLTFHQLVQPALLKMMGAQEPLPIKLQAILTTSLRKKAGRLEFVRGIMAVKGEQLTVTPTFGQDSHMLSGISRANCLIHFPINQELLSEWDSVTVEPLNWSRI